MSIDIVSLLQDPSIQFGLLFILFGVVLTQLAVHWKSNFWSYLLVIVLPVLTVGYLVSSEEAREKDPFLLKHFVSICSPCVIVLALVLNKDKQQAHPNWFFAGQVVMKIGLSINILESASNDYKLGNYWNAALGVLITLLIPSYRDFLIIDDFVKPQNTLRGVLKLAGLDRIWIASYTIWNVVTISNRTPDVVVISCIHLVIPAILMALNSNTELWLHYRAYGLTCYMVVRVLLVLSWEDRFASSWPSNQAWFETFVHWAPAVCIVALVFTFVKSLALKDNKNKKA